MRWGRRRAFGACGAGDEGGWGVRSHYTVSLATREAEQATGLPVLNLAQLSDPAAVSGLLGLDPALLHAPLTPPQPAWPITVPDLSATESIEATVGEDEALDEDFMLSHEVAMSHVADRR